MLHSKSQTIIRIILSALIPLSIFCVFTSILQSADSPDSKLPIYFWFAALATIILGIGNTIVYIVPFFTVMKRNKLERPQYRKEEANILFICSVVSKIFSIPLIILVASSASALYLGICSIGWIISFLFFCTIILTPIGLLIAIVSVYGAIIGTPVVFLGTILSSIAVTSVPTLFGNIQLAAAKKIKVWQVFIGLIFMILPISDIVYPIALLVSSSKHKPDYYGVSTINIVSGICAFIGVGSTIACIASLLNI